MSRHEELRCRGFWSRRSVGAVLGLGAEAVGAIGAIGAIGAVRPVVLLGAAVVVRSRMS
jgi:hypothetical protein